MKILVVGGHPADMFDHCGGTMYHHIQQGDEVVAVSITQGLRTHDEVIYDLFRYDIDKYTQEEVDKIIEERQQVKYKEVVKACNLFGINDVRFLNCDDEILTLSADMVSKLASLIREVQPDMVIAHWPYQGDTFSNHHAVTGQVTLAAVTAAQSVNFNEKHPAAHVAQVVFMLSTHDITPGCFSMIGKAAHPAYYVDVTDVMDLKVKAVTMMGSQKYDIEGYSKKRAEHWNGNFGVRVRLPYAEAFAFQWPEVGKTLNISDYRMWLANADEKDLLKNMSNLSAQDVEI